MAYAADTLALRSGAPGSLTYYHDAGDDTMATVLTAGYFNNTDDDIRMTANDTIIVPILATLPGSRNADGQLVGDLEVVDFAAVRLDAVIEVDIPDPNKPDDPTKTITIRLLVGTIVEVQIASTPSPNPAGIANSVFTLQIVK